MHTYIDNNACVRYNVHSGSDSMSNTNATNLRKNLFDYLNSAIEFNDIINVNTKKGNAVILSEQEYNGLMETLYLCSIPGMKERLEDGLNATIEDCVEFKW